MFKRLKIDLIVNNTGFEPVICEPSVVCDSSACYKPGNWGKTLHTFSACTFLAYCS